MDPWSLLIAGIVSTIAGIANEVSYAQGTNKTENTLEQQKSDAEAQLARNLALMDEEFSVARKNAEKTASNEDRQSTLYEAVFGDQVNADVNQIAMNQKAQGLQNNESMMSAGLSEGNGLSSLAAGGTRNSSAVQATALEQAVNDKNLQMTEDSQRMQGEYQLQSSLNTFAQNKEKLQQQRWEAEDLRTSYQEGGDQYKLYQLNRANEAASGQEKLNRIQSAIDDNKPDWTDYLTVFFSGAKSGYDTGASIANYASDWAKYAKSTKNPLNFSSASIGYSSDPFSNIGKSNLFSNNLFYNLN